MKLLNYNIKPFILVLFCTVNLCLAQSPNITIHSKSKLKKIKPGNHYTILFEIVNQSNKSVKLDFEYVLPSDFKPILTSKGKTIAALGKKNVLFSFSVGKYSKAANHTIELIAKLNNVHLLP